MRLIILGGTGTLGHELTRQLLQRPDAERIVIYSRGECKQVEMSREYPEYPRNIMRYMVGDVRDTARLTQAMRGCDCVIHAAALKHVPVCEYNPQEAVATNVVGSMSVIAACNAAGVKKCMVVSTDKAVEPITLYGATKLCMERLAIAANNTGDCRFSVVRYANVMGSNGSVLQLWAQQKAAGKPLTVTDMSMTRMWITPEKAASFVLTRLCDMHGGETFVPECESRRIYDMACEVAGNVYPIEETGLRPGEKRHEMLISEADARTCYRTEHGWTIYPEAHEWTATIAPEGNRVRPEFRYSSNDRTPA